MIRLGWLLLHLGLITAVCLHETLLLIEKNLTMVPARWGIWRPLKQFSSAITGSSLPRSNIYRQAVQTYVNAAGVEIGYGYFAPNVPDAQAIFFEWTFADGHAEYDAPAVQGQEARLRLTSLVDQIGQTDYAKWRDELVRRLATAAWSRHPKAVSVRVFFGSFAPPTLPEYRAGKRQEEFVCRYVYDFKNNPVRPRQSAP